MNNISDMDFNKVLKMLAKMDKKELEEKLKQAQNILNNQKGK